MFGGRFTFTWCTRPDDGILEHDAHKDSLIELATDHGGVPADANIFWRGSATGSFPFQAAWVTTGRLRRHWMTAAAPLDEVTFGASTTFASGHFREPDRAILQSRHEGPSRLSLRPDE